MKKLLLTLVLSSVSLLAFESANAYKSCVVCHGKHGGLVAVKTSPKLASLSEADLAKRLMSIKNGSTTISKNFLPMHKIKLKNLEEGNVQEFAKYIVNLKQ